MCETASASVLSLSCVRRAFSLGAILSEFAVGYFILASSCLAGRGRRENCSRRLNWMAAINSGQSAGNVLELLPPGQSSGRRYSYLSTRFVAGYLPKVISVCGRDCKYSTLWLSWLWPRSRSAWLESKPVKIKILFRFPLKFKLHKNELGLESGFLYGIYSTTAHDQ